MYKHLHSCGLVDDWLPQHQIAVQVLGADAVHILMGVASTGMAIAACNGQSITVCLATITAAVQAGSDSDLQISLCLQLHGVLDAPFETRPEILAEINAQHLDASMLQVLADPRLAEGCSRLQMVAERSVFNTASKALTRIAAEYAGLFVLDRGLGAFTRMCDELEVAEGDCAHVSTNVPPALFLRPVWTLPV